eukprot:gene11120-biopygen19857
MILTRSFVVKRFAHAYARSGRAKDENGTGEQSSRPTTVSGARVRRFLASSRRKRLPSSLYKIGPMYGAGKYRSTPALLTVRDGDGRLLSTEGAGNQSNGRQRYMMETAMYFPAPRFLTWGMAGDPDFPEFDESFSKENPVPSAPAFFRTTSSASVDVVLFFLWETPNSGPRDRRWTAGLFPRPILIFCAPGARVRMGESLNNKGPC